MSFLNNNQFSVECSGNIILGLFHLVLVKFHGFLFKPEGFLKRFQIVKTLLRFHVSVRKNKLVGINLTMPGQSLLICHPRLVIGERFVKSGKNTHVLDLIPGELLEHLFSLGVLAALGSDAIKSVPFLLGVNCDLKSFDLFFFLLRHLSITPLPLQGKSH